VRRVRLCGLFHELLRAQLFAEEHGTLR
jgi:hypothetical protein